MIPTFLIHFQEAHIMAQDTLAAFWNKNLVVVASIYIYSISE